MIETEVLRSLNRMSVLLIASFFFAATSASVAYEPYEAINPPPPGQWQEVWRDDFDSFDNNPSTNSKWSFDLTNDWANTEMGWGNQEYQYYTSNQKNIRAENGNLIIEVQVETGNKPRSKNGVEFDLTSARIATREKTSWGPNHRFIARAKLPTARTTWPAFWMLPEPQFPGDLEASWPIGGELDIAEHWAKDINMVSSASHCLGTDGKTTMIATKKTFVDNGEQYFSEYHDYEMQLRPDRIDFFIDTKWTFGITKQRCLESGISWPYVNRNFHMLLNLALIEYGFDFKNNKQEVIDVFKNVPPLTKQLIVDYVCVEQLIENNGSSSPQPAGMANETGPVKIKTHHGKYILAQPGQFARVDQSDSPREWEQFTILEYPDGKIAFRTIHGTFLRADGYGNVNTQNVVDTYEKFEKINDNGKLAFKSYHGKYMTAENGQDALIKADRIKIDDWERFEFV